MGRASAPFRVSSLPWHEPPGHAGSLSQYLVGLEEHGAGVDVRMSRCPEGGSVESHAHDDAEQVYIFLAGFGEFTCDGIPYDVTGDMCLYVPRTVEHSLRGTGTEDLVFIVVTSPSGALPR